MSLTVVYAKDTGHVLGALAVTGPAGPLPKIGALVGKELPVRVGLSDGTSVELAIPASQLSVAAVDDLSDALVRPINFGVVPGPDQTPRSALLRLADGLSVTLGAKGVTVAVAGNTSVELPVLVAIKVDDGQVRIEPGRIGSGTDHTIVGVNLTTGKEYGVLALVQGSVGWLEPMTAT
jgi:hypothetical protein